MMGHVFMLWPSQILKKRLSWGVEVHTCNPSTQDHAFEASLGYTVTSKSAGVTYRILARKERERRGE